MHIRKSSQDLVLVFLCDEVTPPTRLLLLPSATVRVPARLLHGVTIAHHPVGGGCNHQRTGTLVDVLATSNIARMAATGE